MPTTTGPGSLPYRALLLYSRRDRPFVRPLEEILLTSDSAIFMGDGSARVLTREEKVKAIDDASLVLVLWCKHAARSREVRREYERALAANKDILPVLLDRTKLPDDLQRFQTLDITNAVESTFVHWILTGLLAVTLLGQVLTGGTVVAIAFTLVLLVADVAYALNRSPHAVRFSADQSEHSIDPMNNPVLKLAPDVVRAVESRRRNHLLTVPHR
jgi:hypothetical protein